jgi:multiple sugar transport system ATP-binding protein
MAEVALDNVSKTYPGGVTAVANLDLSVAEGEFLVLVGPSGCGKSTTLRMIAGLEDVTRGTISIGGRVVDRLPPKDRDVAMVFQNYALYPHLSVFDNMAFGLRRRKTPKAEIGRRVAWAAEMLGIEGLLRRKPHALSGGQRQRVALGRAIVRRPKVFLFDEPLSNLDARLRADTRAELKRLHRKLATTTIYVTHDQEEAMTLGERIVVMRGGRAEQCGPPLDVYSRPANRFVAGFIGTPAMNLIEGQLQEDAGGQLWFELPSVRIPLPDVGCVLARTDGSPHGDFPDEPKDAACVQARTNGSPHGDFPDEPKDAACVQARTLRPGEKCVLGIRPEDLHLQPTCGDAGQRQWSVSGVVELVEPLGSTMDLHVKLSGNHSLVCRAPLANIDADNHVTLYVDPLKIHLFAAVRE